MATDGAGGLSTAAIERCIDNWETETQDGDEIPAARAELVALTGRVAALEGALLDETARRLWTERVLQDRHGHPVGWDWDVGPAVREHWTQVARGRLGRARAVETLAELPARRDADAGDEARCPTCGQATIPFYDGKGRVDHQPAVTPEQLAELRARAGRATALATALVELRESAVELDAAREPRDVALERTALARHRAALAACYRLAIDAGPGAAGARDETAGQPLTHDERAIVYDSAYPCAVRLHFALGWLADLRAGGAGDR
jgi:hypothetical protein